MPKLTLVCKGRDRFISLITPFKMIKKHCLPRAKHLVFCAIEDFCRVNNAVTGAYYAYRRSVFAFIGDRAQMRQFYFLRSGLIF